MTRPGPKPRGLTATVYIRATESERDRWRALAQRLGEPLAEWARRALMREAERVEAELDG